MRKIIHSILLLALLSGVTMLFSTAVFVTKSHAEVVVITNSTVGMDSMPKDELKKIFLGKKIKWSDDMRIKVTALKKGEVHKEFVKMYTKKSTSQFKNYWKNMIFTGKGMPPKQFETESELIDYVSTTDGAIGYISTDKKTDDIKILIINE